MRDHRVMGEPPLAGLRAPGARRTIEGGVRRREPLAALGSVAWPHRGWIHIRRDRRISPPPVTASRVLAGATAG